ncbi:hypothetical protein ILUMI_00316 [Ignelater luminosus]|uniref:Uncharacterized protein n=1 Tax=Ignelater luminosus TaxID=2038154 RepID=A0A8K0DSW0_IGNLU|nr:hypothetical protein ILUMI_00316 [Ignelater luminosus]
MIRILWKEYVTDLLGTREDAQLVKGNQELITDSVTKEEMRAALEKMMLDKAAVHDDDINKEWNNIAKTIQRAAEEALCKRPRINKKKRLKIRNKKLEKVINQKKVAYQKYLQNRSVQTYNEHKKKRNVTKLKIQQSHRESWKKWTKKLEHDLHTRQAFEYRAIANVNKDEKDKARINNIKEEELLKHCKKLWYDNQYQNQEDLEESDIQKVDDLTIEELNHALTIKQKSKSPGKRWY